MSKPDFTKLKGRVVEFTHPQLGGRHYGLVRSVACGPRVGLKSVVVQRSSNMDAASLSAKYQGARHRVAGDLITGVSWYGKIIPVDEFLRG